MVATSVIDVILGEAVHGTREQRYADMVAIASVVQNRATLARATPQSIVSAKRGKNKEFDAYGKSLPKGVEAYRDLAEKAWNQVQTTGPVHNATYYATPSAKGGLPSGLTSVTKTTGHEFFADPKGRSFYTAQGFVTPARETHAAMMSGNFQAINNPYASLVPPAAVQLASLPQTMPAPPMRPEMPRGLEALVPNGLRSVSYSLGPKRPDMPDASVVARAQAAVHDLLGPDARLEVFSGKGKYGSNRHGTGFAIDARVYDKNGTLIGPATHPALSRELGKSFARHGMTGIGMGKEYMGGKGFHLDIVEAKMPGFLNPAKQDREWGSLGNAMKAELDRSRSIGPTYQATKAADMAADAALSPSAPPSMGARAASELQGSTPPSAPISVADLAPPPSPAMGARAASELQGYQTPPASMPAPAMAPARSIEDRAVASVPTAAPPSALASIMAPPSSLSRPTMNAAVPSRSVTSSTVSLDQIGSFPEAPKSPQQQAMGSVARGALTGLVTGGLPGAVIGGLLGPAKAQIGRNMAHNRQNPTNRVSPFNNVFSGYRGMFGGLGGLGGMFSGIPAPNYGATPFSVGSGYGAIGSVFGAPAGATARSMSNPEISFTSLGNGYVSRTNDRYGTTQTMGPGSYDAGMFGGPPASAPSGRGGASNDPGYGGAGRGGLY